MIRLFSNNIDRTLADPITDVATSLTLSNATGLHEPTTVPNVGAASNPPTGSVSVQIPQAEMLTLLGEAGEVEIVRMTARAGNVCTVVRAQEGTTAQAWAAGTRVIAASTAGTYGAFLQNSSTHAQGIAIDDHRITRAAWQGYASASGQWSLCIGPNGDADGIYATAIGGEFAGAQAYSTAIGAQARAYGQRSVSLGWAAQNNEGERTTILGGFAMTNEPNNVLVGYRAIANRQQNVLVGGDTLSQGGQNVIIGKDAKSYGYEPAVDDPYSWEKVQIGWGSVSEVGAWGCVAIGSQTEIWDDAAGAIAIGYNAVVEMDATLGIALGNLQVDTPRTCQIGALHAVGKNNRTYTTSDAAWAMTSATSVIMSDVVDLKTVADVTTTIPTGVRFFPDEVGLVIVAATGVTGQPTIRFGITGTLDKLLAATATTGLDAAHKRERFQTLASSDGESSLTAGVTVGATATTLTGRFYWKGFAVVNSV